MAHHGGGVFWMFRLVVNLFVGVLVPARTKLIELGGEIAEARMAKDVKVVKNIKTSVTSFWDICTNGHLLR
jgi:hypothetical protein